MSRPGWIDVRGFSITEMVLTAGIAATLAAIAVPTLTAVSEATRLSNAAQQVERTLQTARMRAVSQNTPLRFRSNCPVAGYYRVTEVMGTTADNNLSRCDISSYPWPAPTDMSSSTHLDGQLRQMINNATVSSQWLEFHPDGTAWSIDPTTFTATAIATTVSITVTRNGQSKTITINALGKVLLQ